MINYWKPCENIRREKRKREKKKLIIIGNVQNPSQVRLIGIDYIFDKNPLPFSLETS
jgi:hypothetical protein